MSKDQSMEPAVVRNYTDLLSSLNIHFYEQQINMGNSIDVALKNAESKRGGTGDNRPDIKLLLDDGHARRVPVMIEAKGIKGRLEKTTKDDEIELVTIYDKDGKQREDGSYTHKAGDKNYKAIENYAVNGAIHYAHAILDAQDYTEVIAIGVNGYGEGNGKVKNLECKAYYISEKNSRVPKLIPNITATDWLLLKPGNATKLYAILDTLSLTQDEYEKMVSRAESDLDAKILKIHQKIYDDKAITLNTADKMYLFCGLIMAGLSADGLEELKADSLRSSTAEKQSDGAKIMNQIEAFLDCKKCPEEKKQMILRILASVFTHEDLWKPINGESILKSLYKHVKTDIVPCLESPLHLDFMGRIFNRLGDWLPIAADVKNDVVLTPRYVAKLMANLCRVDKDSFVWDRTMGSAGFLVTAMDLMIKDAQETINDVNELANKIDSIKKQQLFGIESLPEVFILAVVNMILMGDGSSKMVRGDGHDKNLGKHFPANVFLLNPPYSAEGKGFIFVEEALSMMDNGYAAVLIQENAGSGQGLPYTKEILKRNTLVASIHMPSKLFVGKAGVQTAIYVFEINKKHHPKNLVKFIDFSNDGYFRQSKKKSSQDVNLKNIDDAFGRYAEIEAVVCGQKPDTEYYTKENGLYIEDTITLEGNDWTFAQHRKTNTESTEEDFRKTMQDFMSWKISKAIHGDDNSAAMREPAPKLKEFRLDEVFEKIKTNTLPYKVTGLPTTKDEMHSLPALTAGIENQGLSCYVPRENATILKNCISVSANGANTGVMFYQPDEFTILQDSYALQYKGAEQIGEKEYLYLIAVAQKNIRGNYDWSNKAGWERIRGLKILLPVTATEKLDFEYMKQCMVLFGQESAGKIDAFLSHYRKK